MWLIQRERLFLELLTEFADLRPTLIPALLEKECVHGLLELVGEPPHSKRIANVFLRHLVTSFSIGSISDFHVASQVSFIVSKLSLLPALRVKFMRSWKLMNMYLFSVLSS